MAKTEPNMGGKKENWPTNHWTAKQVGVQRSGKEGHAREQN